MNKPFAAPGLHSYRARGQFGFIFIGAKNDADAINQAKRSTDHPTDIRYWDGSRYVPVYAAGSFPSAEAA